MTASAGPLHNLVEALASGDVEVIDLTHPLSDRTPVIELPEPFANTPSFGIRKLSRYDDCGPAWYWNAVTSAEHVGTHLDAPIHWITGRDGDDVASIPARRLIGPAVVIDRTNEARANPDFLLTIDDVQGFEAEHGQLPAAGWLLLRTGWAERHSDRHAYLGNDRSGPHWPGPSVELARWLANKTDLLGFGQEPVGIDAGIAHTFDPIYPAHHYLLGSGKYGLASLANLDKLPSTGAVLIAAPLRIENGSGSSMRALALVPR